MKTAITSKKISTLLRLDETVKKNAQKAAESINLPLSVVVNNYLYHFGKNKELAFEYPSPKLIAMIESSLSDIEKGDVSPKFTNAKDAMRWLSAQ